MTHSRRAPTFLPILGVFVPSPEGTSPGLGGGDGAAGVRWTHRAQERSEGARQVQELPSPQEEMGLRLSQQWGSRTGGPRERAAEAGEVARPTGGVAESACNHQGPN